ncbi:MAG: hypothetical protein CL581_03690 [Alteromonadaceae bacterium]|nr:hypothetical protein [Alteromonadaceae bacterium]
MIEVDKNKLHFMTPGDCIETIAKSYLDGLDIGWDTRATQCFYLVPEDKNHEAPAVDAVACQGSCAVGALLRHSGVTPRQLWDKGIRNEHPADRVADAFDIRIADWDAIRIGRFLQLCQQLHDQFAQASEGAASMPPRALGYMFRLMAPAIISASGNYIGITMKSFAGDVNTAIRNAFKG